MFQQVTTSLRQSCHIDRDANKTEANLVGRVVGKRVVEILGWMVAEARAVAMAEAEKAKGMVVVLVEEESEGCLVVLRHSSLVLQRQNY